MKIRVIICGFLVCSFPLFSQNFFDDDEIFFESDVGITIVGTPQTSQQTAIITREDIEQLNSTDLASLLQETLNLNIARYGAYGNQTSIHLRGFSSRRVAFLIDGVPANSLMDGGFDVNQIDLHSIERIEVIYGGSDSTFNVSGALGGVINIITTRTHNPGWQFSGSVSNTSALPGKYRDRSDDTQGPHWKDLFDAQHIAVSAIFGNSTGGNTAGGRDFSLRTGLFANRAANHFIFWDDFSETHRRKDNNEVWDAGAQASGIWELSGFSRLIASTHFYYGDKNIPTSGFSRLYGNQKDLVSRQTLMLESPRAFHDNLAAQTSLAWHFARIDYTSPADILSRHDQYSLNLINRWAWYPGGQCTLRSGFDYRFIRLNSTEAESRYRHDGGIYLTMEFKPAGHFQVIPSVKTVFTSTGSMSTTVIPKLGLLWHVNDFLTLRNNYFRSFKYPELEELYWSGAGGGSGIAAGNPDLRAEDGWGGDIGATLILEMLSLESGFFTQWLKDSIHWAPGGNNTWRPENIGEALFFGLDTRISAAIPVSIGPVNTLSPSLSYQYLRSYLLSFGYTFASNKRIPYNPEHTIGGSLDIGWGSGSLLISAHFESRRFHDRANLIVLQPHFLLNAVFNQNITGNLTIFGSLRNILNTSYESFYDYPMPGITLTLGIRITIEAANNEKHL